MGRFRIQLILPNVNGVRNTWKIKKSHFISISTEWRILDLDFTEGIKLIYDQIDTAVADVCFSNNLITHSVF